MIISTNYTVLFILSIAAAVVNAAPAVLSKQAATDAKIVSSALNDLDANDDTIASLAAMIKEAESLRPGSEKVLAVNLDSESGEGMKRGVDMPHALKEVEFAEQKRSKGDAHEVVELDGKLPISSLHAPIVEGKFGDLKNAVKETKDDAQYTEEIEDDKRAGERSMDVVSRVKASVMKDAKLAATEKGIVDAIQKANDVILASLKEREGARPKIALETSA